MSAKRVTAVVRFAAEMADDDIKADDQADSISDAIADAVSRIGLGVYAGSASVIGWTESE